MSTLSPPLRNLLCKRSSTDKALEARELTNQVGILPPAVPTWTIITSETFSEIRLILNIPLVIPCTNPGGVSISMGFIAVENSLELSAALLTRLLYVAVGANAITKRVPSCSFEIFSHTFQLSNHLDSNPFGNFFPEHINLLLVFSRALSYRGSNPS